MFSTILHIFSIAVFIGIAVGIGIVLDRVVIRSLRILSEKGGWTVSAKILRALSGFFIVWALMLGVYLKFDSFSMTAKAEARAEQIIEVLFILSFTFFLMRLAVGLIKALTVQEHGEGLGKTTILVNLTRLMILLLGLLFIFNSVGVSITPLITALGIGGLAVSLALQGTLSNLFAGIQLASMKELSVGDIIRLHDGGEGHVTDIGWRVTTVKTYYNSLLVIPNSVLASEKIVNYALPNGEHRVIMKITLEFGTDLTKTEKLMLDELNRLLPTLQGALMIPAPAVRYSGLNEIGIQTIVSFQTRTYGDVSIVKHEVIKSLETTLTKAGISFAVGQTVAK